MLETCLVVCRFLHFVSTMVLAGGSVLVPVLVGPAPTLPRWQQIQWALAAVATATAVLWLLLLTDIFSGDATLMIDPKMVAVVLGQTDFGHVWRVRLIVSFMLLVALGFGRRARGIPIALALALLVSLACTGHAVREAHWLGRLHEANQMLHLLAGSLWLGGLVILLWLLVMPKADMQVAGRALRRFSGLGYGVVAVLLTTGSMNSWFMLTTFGDLTASAYGRTLGVKIVMVTGMIVLAAANRFLLAPFLSSGPPIRHRLIWSVGIETALGAAVLAVTAVLGMAMPPDG